MKLAKVSLLVYLVFSFAAASDATARPRLLRWGRAPRGACGAAAGYSYSPAQKYSMPVQKGSPVQADEPVQKGDDPTQKSAVQKSGAQLHAEYKVRFAAARRIRGHIGGSFGPGCSAEGVGFGTTAAQALGNCCRFNRPLAAQAVARDSSGRWYAIKLYR